MRTFESIAHGRSNNFDALRFIAASAVIFSHAFPLTGASAPLSMFPGYDLGRMAVTVFFAISGLLITKSFLRTPTLGEFLAARIMRLFPGLIVTLALTALVLGPLVTTLPLLTYFGQKAPWGYIARNVTLHDLRMLLPGVFEDNPLPGAVNGSIWTLPWEVAFYAGVLGAGLTGFLSKARGPLILTAYVGAYVWFRGSWFGPQPAWEELSLPFVVGAALYVFRRSITLSMPLLALACGLVCVTWNTPFSRELLMLTIAYGAFLVAALPSPSLANFGKYGDFSYGIYIYGFVAEQTVIHYWPGLSGINLGLVTFSVTLPLAIASWHFVEKPALARRFALGRWLAAPLSVPSFNVRRPAPVQKDFTPLPL